MKYTIAAALAVMAVTVHAEEEKQKPTITEAEKASIVGSGNDFASDMYGQLKTAKGNFFFSPESITQALAMTYAGARSETASEMQSALHFRMNNDYTHATLGELMRKKNTRSAAGNYIFHTANALWVQKGYELQESYLTLVNNNYEAKVSNLDFETDTQGAASTINQWVEEKTANKIRNLVSADVLSKDTRLVLTNAVYFKADWKKAFEKSATRQEDFYQNPAQNTKAMMMSRTCDDCKYAENENYQALALPYKGDDIEMVVFLPRDKNGLAAFEQALNPQTLRQGLEALATGVDVNVALPRFKLESQFSLAKTLPALGMKMAFDSARADFSGMTGKRDLFISDVIHKAFVEVDEVGTEAAAATAVVTGVTSVPMARPVKEFRADHPFVFLLRDAHSGAVYFMGRMENPAY